MAAQRSAAQRSEIDRVDLRDDGHDRHDRLATAIDRGLVGVRESSLAMSLPPPPEGGRTDFTITMHVDEE